MGSRIQGGRAGVTTTGAASNIIETSFTRPADTTQYAAGDVVSNATATTHAYLTFAGMALSEGGSGVIVASILVGSASETAKPDFELWLFDRAPTAMEDNAAFDPSDAEMATVVAVIPFDAWYVGTASGNSLSMGNLGVFPYVCGSTSKDLYGLVVERSTYTPVSAEVFTFRLQVQQD